jgi:hypothetical protein
MKRTHLLCLIIALTIPACSKAPANPELVRAARSIEQVVAPFSASRSSFFVVLPNGSPRQFVSWFFSTMGTAEWAPVDSSNEFSPEELDALRQIGLESRPNDVVYRHTQPDPKVQKQIVMKWDDAEGTVILEGYLDPNQPPAYTRSFKLPKGVVPDQAARLITQSNLEQGMEFQSF